MVFYNIVTGDETWVYYFEPTRKVANRICAIKNASSIAKQMRMVKKVLYAVFTNKGPAIEIPVPKGRTVIGKFYKNKRCSGTIEDLLQKSLPQNRT